MWNFKRLSPTKFGIVRGLTSSSSSIALAPSLNSSWIMVYRKKGRALFGELKSLIKRFFKPTFMIEYSGFDSEYMMKVNP